jgi:hypothetical protein
MKKSNKYYILNTITGSTFDTNEMKFYSASWDIELEEKHYLEIVMKNNPKLFENCKIVKV